MMYTHQQVWKEAFDKVEPVSSLLLLFNFHHFFNNTDLMVDRKCIQIQWKCLTGYVKLKSNHDSCLKSSLAILIVL